MVVNFPCEVGQIVYKICPKCNAEHNNSCKNCAWCGCSMHYCDINFRVYQDGSCMQNQFQLVPIKVTRDNLIQIVEYFGVYYFATEQEGNSVIKLFDYIKKLEKKDRISAYEEFILKHKTFNFGG